MHNFGPQPEEIYKEWTFHPSGHADGAHSVHIGEVDPAANHPLAEILREDQPISAPRYLLIEDLEFAIKAELSIEYWGGHIGTSFKGFSLNDNPWLSIMRPQHTPTDPERYHHTFLSSLSTPIPIDYLKNGINSFKFGAGPQVDYSFDCGFFWIYSFTVRIYYSNVKQYTGGKIVFPKKGSVISDNPIIKAEIYQQPIAQIDFLANYKDFNWSGDGIYHQWQAQICYGILRRHIGHRIVEPFQVKWNTEWVPDQEEPIQISAQVTATNGIKYMLPAVTDIHLRRRKRSVVMYKPINIPENFSVRSGERKTCDFEVIENTQKIIRAKLILSTWSGAHAEEIGMNGVLLTNNVGKVHDYSFDSIEIPVNLLKQGINQFHIYSNTSEHAAEINWPGPALLVEYQK